LRQASKIAKGVRREIEEFIDYAICVAKNGNTLTEDQHNFLEKKQS